MNYGLISIPSASSFSCRLEEGDKARVEAEEQGAKALEVGEVQGDKAVGLDPVDQAAEVAEDRVRDLAAAPDKAWVE